MGIEKGMGLCPKGRDREGSGLEESRLRATVTTVVSVFSFMLLLIVRIKS